MTIVLDLPPEAEASLRRRAARQGGREDDLAARLLVRLLADDEADFQESVSAIRQGFADVDAGRTVAFEEFVTQSRAHRARRLPLPGAGSPTTLSSHP